MNWRHKALLQKALSVLPGGEHVYYLMQRHVTRTLPPLDQKFLEAVAIEVGHVQAYREFGLRPVDQAVFYQFGAGWTLTGPLTFYASGVDRQILVDIRRLIRPELINATIEKFQRLHPSGAFARIPEHFLNRRTGLAIDELKQHYGIDYRAPADARSPQVPDNSVDCITSTNTLEHVPAEDIPAILAQCHRILKPGGIISFRVDYQDHFSYVDRRLNVYHFLQFDERHWRRFNSPLHYQNRLRHRDYLSVYREAGFEKLRELPSGGSQDDLAQIRLLKVAKRFSTLSPEELAVRYSDVVLRKPLEQARQVRAA